MSFPLDFSSTLTYANRYDLDEIDVFLEGDSTNPMFFDITGLPNQLSFGKHFFYIALRDDSDQSYSLRNNSQILFEFKSVNNVILKSDVTDVNQRNGLATCFVEVLKDPKRTFKEVEDGLGTLTLVGSLTHNKNTTTPIDDKFREKMNYRCSFPIEIRKNLLNASSPITINITHTRETINGRFPFGKNAISRKKGMVDTKGRKMGMVYVGSKPSIIYSTGRTIKSSKS